MTLFHLGRRLLSTVTTRSKLYGTGEKILILGDGNLSFSHSLAYVLKDGSGITATTFDTADQLLEMYPDVEEHMFGIMNAGGRVITEIDATKVATNGAFEWKSFDKICFNQPYGTIFGQDWNPAVVRKNQDLIKGYFLNASKLIKDSGEIHLSNKVDGPYNLLKIRELATESGLKVIREMKFPDKDYPLYQNKKGFGPDAQKSYKLHPSKTWILKK